MAVTAFHPTADQALRPIQSLLDNENKAIADGVLELRRRAINKARLEIALLLITPNPEIEETEETSEAMAQRLANARNG